MGNKYIRSKVAINIILYLQGAIMCLPMSLSAYCHYRIKPRCYPGYEHLIPGQEQELPSTAITHVFHVGRKLHRAPLVFPRTLSACKHRLDQMNFLVKNDFPCAHKNHNENDHLSGKSILTTKRGITNQVGISKNKNRVPFGMPLTNQISL